jgi:signal transduction histidine kinase
MKIPIALHRAVARALGRVGVDALTLDHIAEEAGMTRDELAQIHPTVTDALREMVIGSYDELHTLVSAEVRAAKDGSDAMTRYVTELVRDALTNVHLFRAAYMTRQIVGNHRFGLDHATLNERLVPSVNRLLDDLEVKLVADKGPTELAGGIHPRRLAFVTHMLGVGIATITSLAKSTPGGLRHSDESLLREATMAIGAATSSVNQMAALNDAAKELAQLRTEADLFDMAPMLLQRALEFDDAAVLRVADGLEGALTKRALDEGGTVFHESEGKTEMATPLRYEGTVLSVLSGSCSRVLGERDVARIETLASMLGLAHENVRFYENLQSLVDERTRELRDAQTALVQSERMAASATLVAGLAHEINTPMASLLANTATIETAVEKLTDETAKPRTRERMAEVLRSAAVTIRDGSERVGDILDKLKRFSRLDASERAEIDINACLRDAIAIAEPKLAACQVNTELSELPPVTCEPAQLNQVFLQVLLNAAQASPTIITVTSRRDDESIVITIADDGEGIEETIRDRVFDPGFTTRGVGVGAGMGLSIAHRVMQDHGGTIELSSSPDGTNVTLVLPIGAAAGAAQSPAR